MATRHIPVIRTKVIIPQRRKELLSRQRLLDLLLEFLDEKLTIIAAPAGYGKTSLMIDFASHIEMPVCWFSLDPLDQDPQRFIAYFIASLQQRFPRFGKKSQIAVENSSQDQLNLDNLISTVINDVYENITEHFTIILDDYHLVGESKLVETFINRFIQDVDENCHVVIASRALLALPDMTLMVARSQVNGLSFEELAFRPEEIQGLLQQNYQMSISLDLAQAMVNNTEGWITGLLLSTQVKGRLSQNQLRVEKVSGIDLYEYMAQQVLDQQPPEIQEFLLRTSLLEEFDASLCATVIGQALDLPNVDWDALMETLLKSNLFILPVGEDRLFLRYHHLFRDFLQSRMLEKRSKEAKKIQYRLAKVYCKQGEWERAYDLLQKYGETEEISELILDAATFMFSHGRLQTLSSWLEAVPERQLSASAGLLSIQGSVAVTRGDTLHGIKLLNQAIDSLKDTEKTGFLERSLVRRSAAYHLIGEYRLAIEDADRALSLSTGHESLKSVHAEAMRLKGMCHYNLGDLQEALIWLSRSSLAYRTLEDERNIATVSMETGMVFRATGDIGAAREAYLKALDFWQKTGNSVGQANLLNNLGVLQHMQGDYDSAISSFERADQHAQAAQFPRWEAFALASIGDLYRDLQLTSEALEAYQKAVQIAQQINDRYLNIYLNLAEAHLSHHPHSDHLIATALKQAEDGKSAIEISLCHMERGIADIEDGLYQEAMDELQPVATYFKKENRRIEAAQAFLYLAIAAQGSKQTTAIEDTRLPYEFLVETFAMLPEARTWQPLIAIGDKFKPLLESLKDESRIGIYVMELLQGIQQFIQRLPELRRHLRPRVTTVPVGPPHLTIHALGRMQVKLNDHLVSSGDWQAQLARNLFFLILSKPEGLTKDQIGVIFWPDDSQDEINLRYKNAIYRLRHALGKDVVILDNERYRFNRSLDYGYDVDTFKSEIDLAEQGEDRERKISHYKAALRAYHGPYLPDLYEEWAEEDRKNLAQVYINTLLKISTLFLEVKEYKHALTYCQLAIDHDPCLEEAHCLAMRAYAEMDNRAAILKQYQLCQQMLHEEMDTSPSAQTQALFNELTQ